MFLFMSSKFFKLAGVFLISFSLLVPVLSGIKVGAVNGPNYDPDSKIIVDNQTTTTFEYVVCENQKPYSVLNNIDPTSKDGNIYIIETISADPLAQPVAFDKTINHSLEIKLVDESVLFSENAVSNTRNSLFKICNGQIKSLTSKAFSWKKGTDNKLALKGTVIGNGQSPLVFEPFQPDLTLGYTPYSKYNSLQSQSQKLYIKNYTQGVSSVSGFSNVDKNLPQICVNGSLVNLTTVTLSPFQTENYFSIPGGSVNLAKPNFNFSNPCDTIMTGEYKYTANIIGGLDYYYNFKELATGSATKDGLMLTQVDTPTTTSIYVNGAEKICVNQVLTNSDSSGSNSFGLSAGTYTFSLPKNITDCALDSNANSTLKLTLESNKKYTLTKFTTKGLDLEKTTPNSGYIDFRPYQTGFNVYNIDSSWKLCVNGAVNNNFVEYGNSSSPTVNRFYDLSAGSYSLNLTENNSCSNVKFPSAAFDIQASKYTNVEANVQLINPGYSISGLILEGGDSVLHLEVGDVTAGGNYKLRFRCNQGLCTLGNIDLANSADSNTYNYDINIEFLQAVSGGWIDLTLVNSSNIYPDLSGTFLNGILFNSNFASSIKSVQVVANFDKAVFDKYNQIGGYFSNSPWQAATTSYTKNGNTYTYVSQVNGSFKQFAFAGQTSTTSLANTGDSIPYFAIFSALGVFVIALFTTLLYKRRKS